MSVVSMRELLEAGVHFGHQTRRWNPKMRRFIFTERGGIYIIDLQQTSAAAGRSTRLRPQHRGARRLDPLRRHEEAEPGRRGGAGEARQHAVRQPPLARRPADELAHDLRPHRPLHELRRLKEEGQLDLLPAKERISMLGELEKLEENLGGVADMKRQPDAVFIVDLRKEQLAVREARRLGLPVVALVDTNCDPDEADYVIPGNDDAIRSCDLIVRAIADGIAAGQQKATPADFAAWRRTASRPRSGSRRRRSRRPRPRPSHGRGRRRRRPKASPPSGEPTAGGGAGRMTEISAALVKELRDQTGAPMMDCKRALQRDERRHGGRRSASCARRAWRAPRSAPTARRPKARSATGSATTARRGTMVAVGCETEPVSNNDEFLAFAKKVLEAVEADGPGAEATLDEERLALVRQARREHRRRRQRLASRRSNGGDDRGRTRTRPRNKLGVLAAGARRLGRARAQGRDAHRRARPAAGSAAKTCRRTSSQRSARSTPNSDEVQSKPEQAREKIVEGMLNKRFFADRVSTEQPWIHDTSKTVGQALVGGRRRGAGVRAVRAERRVTVQPEETPWQARRRQLRSFAASS